MTKNRLYYLFTLVLLLHLVSLPCFSQQKSIDSLLNILLHEKRDSKRFVIYASLTEKCDEQYILAYCDSAMNCFQKLSSADQGSENTLKYLAAVWNNKGYACKQHGDFKQALECYQQCMKIYERLGMKIEMAGPLNNIGALNREVKDYEHALENYKKSLAIFEVAHDTNNLATVLNNIGLIYDETGKRDLSLEYYKRCLQIKERMHEKAGMGFALNNIGLVYFENKDNKTAMDYLMRSLKVREEIGDKRSLAFTLGSIASVYLSLNNFSEALQYGKRAMKLSQEVAYPTNIRNSADILKRIYKKMGDNTHALEMYELYILMRDSINDVDNKKSVYKQQIKFDFEKKEASTLALQEKKDEIALRDKELREYNQLWVELICSVIILSLISFAFIFYKRYMSKKRTSEELAVKNEIIEVKQKEILDSIHYAKRIQQSLLPTEIHIERTLKRLKK